MIESLGGISREAAAAAAAEDAAALLQAPPSTLAEADALVSQHLQVRARGWEGFSDVCHRSENPRVLYAVGVRTKEFSS